MLHERGHTGGRVDDESGEGLDERFRDGGVAAAPAGHREGLGQAVNQDRSVRHARFGGDRPDLAVVDDLRVDLIAQHPCVGGCDERGCPRHVGRWEETASGVMRRVENDKTRARCQCILELVDGEREISPLMEAERDRRGAGKADRRLVDRKARIRIHDLVAWSAGGEDAEKQKWLCASGDQHSACVER